jgi:menaquinone-dependent protoporphyrinogen oxidase
MRALVTVASKHGSTAGIGQAISETLNASGVEAELQEPSQVTSLDAFDVVVLGSAVYAGHWMSDAKEFADRFRPQLRELPVWLFSSGPIGDPPKPDEEPVDAVALIEAIEPRGHMVFTGKLDKKSLGFAERAIVAAFHAPEGDFRDWTAIESWAGEIAGSVLGSGATHQDAV